MVEELSILAPLSTQQLKALILHGWRLSSKTRNPITSPWKKQLPWLRIVHSGDWFIRLALCTPSGACHTRRRRRRSYQLAANCQWSLASALCRYVIGQYGVWISIDTQLSKDCLDQYGVWISIDTQLSKDCLGQYGVWISIDTQLSKDCLYS